MTNLKQLRTDSGLSQQALAEKFNLSQQSIYKYENELAEPDINTLKEFADFFGVSIDYLVGYHTDASGSDDDFVPTRQEIQILRGLRRVRPDVRQCITDLINCLP